MSSPINGAFFLPVNLEIASLTNVPSSKAKASPALNFSSRQQVKLP
jgi:hypothetical protein